MNKESVCLGSPNRSAEILITQCVSGDSPQIDLDSFYFTVKALLCENGHFILALKWDNGTRYLPPPSRPSTVNFV